MQTTLADIEAFRKVCQARIDEHYKGSTLFVPTITTEIGKRYVRMVSNRSADSRSVFCFLDQTNGDVLKAANWKAPAKHARGNIFNADRGQGAISAYGANYLR